MSQLRFVCRKRHETKPELRKSDHVCGPLPGKRGRRMHSMELCLEQNRGKPVGHPFVTQTDLKQVFKFAERLIVQKLGN